MRSLPLSAVGYLPPLNHERYTYYLNSRLIISLLWSIVGMSTAVNLRGPQDYGLVVAGVMGTILMLIQNREAKKKAQQGALADAKKLCRRTDRYTVIKKEL